jgi:hypothetical protein
VDDGSDDPIVTRIARALGGGGAVEALVALPATDLQSLMLHVYRRRSARRSPAELLAQYLGRPMLQPANMDTRALAALERLALACAADFEALDLSPVAPLGLNAVLGRIDQNNCLATARTAEVLADPTAVQALECARRRRAGSEGTIKLCACSRPLRLQPYEGPGFWPHFGLFSLVSAGRDRGGHAFEMESLREHLGVYLTFLLRLPEEGYRIGQVKVAVSDTERDEARLGRAEAEVLAPLGAAFPSVSLTLDRAREQGRDYYSGLCLRVDATDAGGAWRNLADGGFSDWTRRLCSNRKERLLTSGMGIELLTKLFR